MTSASAHRTADDVKDLVLVGGGHAHVQVLRRFAMRPEPGVRISVVLDRAEAVYSGMVPGFVAGDYRASELEIDVVPLARRARARVILRRASRIDAADRRIELEGRPSIPYDVASIDVGSSVRGLEIPGVREWALATRPIRSFVDEVDEAIRSRASAGKELRIVVVGAGAAGLELAFTLSSRLARAGARAAVRIVSASQSVLEGHPQAVADRVSEVCASRGIEIACGHAVVEVKQDAVVTERASFASDLVVWATGAAPTRLVTDSPLPKGGNGFVAVEETLEVQGHDGLFAVGDCAHLLHAPWVPKAGVYAVREGPVLARNLRAACRGERLARYTPQRDFLALLHLGDGAALGAKWGRVASGRAVWRLKDAIDRRFMDRFTILHEDGRPTAALPSPEAMGMEEMECGGCAAKLESDSLEQTLGRLSPAPQDPSVALGLGDDAALVRDEHGQETLLTVDGFRAFTDDPWLVGRVAGANAISDVYACGGIPRHAMVWVQLPDIRGRRAREILFQVMSGVRASLDPVGVSVVGGHTTLGEELTVGLSVSGHLGGRAMLGKGGLAEGDALLLTKPLGTGVVLAADMRGLARGRWLGAAIASMEMLNDGAAEVARSFDASACTDVSGFGMAIHLGEMLRASGAAARLSVESIPALPGARFLLERGERSTFHDQNAARGEALLGRMPQTPEEALLFDPQTSGGLLIGVAPERAEACLASLRAGGTPAAKVGIVVAVRPGQPLIAIG